MPKDEKGFLIFLEIGLELYSEPDFINSTVLTCIKTKVEIMDTSKKIMNGANTEANKIHGEKDTKGVGINQYELNNPIVGPCNRIPVI